MDAGLRIDKWLWFARLCKSRSLAQALIDSGAVRLNGTPVAKASLLLRPGDEILIPQGRGWRRVRVVALGDRRGPASEARTLYDERPAPALSPDGELMSP
jgi:ribosome-associated heat shock protein Hsp15